MTHLRVVLITFGFTTGCLGRVLRGESFGTDVVTASGGKYLFANPSASRLPALPANSEEVGDFFLSLLLIVT